MEPSFLWVPSPESIRQTNLWALMQERSAENYTQLHTWSVLHPLEFWQRTIAALNIRLRKPWRQLVDVSHGVAHARWLAGAEMNIAESCFTGDPDAIAIITRRQDGRMERITVAELDRLSSRVANGMPALGVGKGDAVAIDMAMTAEAVAIYLGIIKAGAAVISIPDSLPAEEIARRLRIGAAKAVFTQDILVRAGKSLPMYDKVREAGAPKTVVLSAATQAAAQLRPGDLPWQEFLSSNEQFEAMPCSPHDAANIIFSSGTTGDPKAIPWDHTTPVKSASDAMYHHDVHRGDVLCWPTNLGWMMGPWLVFAALLNRATIALYEGAPTERGFCEFVQNAGITMLGLVPSIVKSWRSTGAADGLDWGALRCYSSSGEASDANDYGWLMQLNQRDGSTRPVIEYCGGTEIGGGYAASTLIAPHRPSEFNALAMGSDVVFLNAHNRHCEPGDTGEVYIRPPSIGLSTRILNFDNDEVYYKKCPVVDGRTLRRHGDQVIVGEGGRFRSDGRADDAMNLGGIKVGSVEIERTLNLLPPVLESAAVAVPPPGGGPDRLVIFTVLRAGSTHPQPDALKKQMQQAVKEHLNPLFHVEDVVIVDALPRTASNKVMRKELRKQYGQRVKAG